MQGSTQSPPAGSSLCGRKLKTRDACRRMSACDVFCGLCFYRWEIDKIIQNCREICLPPPEAMILHLPRTASQPRSLRRISHAEAQT